MNSLCVKGKRYIHWERFTIPLSVSYPSSFLWHTLTIFIENLFVLVLTKHFFLEHRLRMLFRSKFLPLALTVLWNFNSYLP